MTWRARASAASAAVALIATLAAAPANAAPNNNTVRKLTQAVTTDGVLTHLEALQAVADANGGNRAAGRPGYAASVEYIVGQLEANGYDAQVQAFQFPYVEDNSEMVRVSPNARVFANGTDFLRNRFDSGVPEGTATGPLVNVDLVLNPSGPPNTSSSGCDAADWAGFPAGGVALVQRGTCGFNVKVLNAQGAGASAVIVMNEGQPGRTGLVGMIGDATGLHIPAVFATFDAGLNLATTAGSTVRVTVDFTSEQRTAWNVVTETAGGNPRNVVMAGAHLDSRQEGAGINDNGSGSAALLETAIQMAKVNTTNKVRFAWWGAEESGLLGSTHYVGQLSEEAADDIALYLNFDMIASPNYTNGIYDGDNSGGTAPPGLIPPGSAEIEDQFESFFTARGEPFKDTDFSGRSDYGPFIAIGIPAGGLFTGAEVPKTAAEAAIFGGVAGAQLDPCYHQFCDNLRGDGHNAALFSQLAQDYELVGNINVDALDVNSDALAATVLTFAYDSSSVNAVAGKPGKSNGLYKFEAAR
jgi:Zn-dependent M28 family amino/carboxypeptidase